MLIWELTLVALLIVLNGFFAMSEIAVVSARRARLQHMAQSGSRAAGRALRLAEDPTGFLSTVQVGITLVGIFAGAYGGATLAEPLAAVLRPIPQLSEMADDLALGIVIVAITYLSLIAGELVPKRIALNNAERIAALVAAPMHLLARLGRPIVWFLGISTNAVLALLRIQPKGASTVSEEEVRLMIAEGTDAGVFHPAEREMIESVLAMADRTVRAIMVPRPEVIWLDVNDPAETNLAAIRKSGHSRFPVSEGDLDEDLGIVHAKDLLEQLSGGGGIDLRAASHEPLYVPETMPILKLIDRFKTTALHMAVVVDEHGSFEGLVTPTDVLTAIAGALPEHPGEETSEAVQREDGSWLLDGRLPIDKVERTLGLRDMQEDEDFVSLAGFVLYRCGHVPEVGESFVWRGWRFEVVDLDGRRIDKVLASPVAD
ncbi:MAG: hemolysin family protein [Rhodospirillales bacterium]